MTDELDSDPAYVLPDTELFEVALEAVGEAVLVTKPDLDAPGPVIVYANPAFYRLTGYSREEVIGRSPRFLQGPETDRAVLDRVRQMLSRGAPFQGEAVNYRKDGSTYHIEWLITPMRDGSGQLRHWIAVQRDITGLRQTEAALREARDRAEASDQHQKLLVAELQHRSRNLLGVVVAVANRTLRRGDSVEAFAQRLQALSRVQGLLSQGGSDTVEVGALIRAELAAYADDGSRVTISGPEVHLTVRQVQNFALAVHELTTNAVKYGALKVETGQLAVSWDVVCDQRERPRLGLSWVESGISVDLEKITRRGYGTELIQEALAYAMQAEVDYVLSGDGVRCRIEMPIS